MELAGHKCVGFCEFDKWAVASYTSMHLITDEQRKYLATLDLKHRQKEILKEEYRNGEWYANDIRYIDAEKLPEAECWAFGFPCQDISVAGFQKGFRGNRSSLFFRVTYLLRQLKEEKRPDTLFIENVKNLLSVNGGWDFAKLLIELDEIGYDTEWKVFDSETFGVPQHRERCFIIGHLRERERYRRGILFEGINTPEIARSECESLQKREGIICGYGHEPKLTNKSTTIGAYQGKGTSNQQMTFVCVPCITPNRVNKRQNGRRFKENGDAMFTLTAQDRHGVAVDSYGNHPSAWWDKYKTFVSIRRLTPRECFRLQGWPDDYFEKACFVNSDAQLYK